MRIGIAPSGLRSAAGAVRIARQAEDAGLDEVWVSEDYTERGAFAVTGAMAAVTQRVRIGIGVVNPWTRHVVLTAMEAQALDEIADGRSVLGLGASNAGWMSGRLGIDFERPISVLSDYTAALRRLLAGERVTDLVRGQRLDTALDARPPRTIPLVWGVKGPRALQLGAQEADGLFLSVLSSPEYVRWVATEHGAPELTAYATFSVGPDRASAVDRLRVHTAKYLGLHGASAITEHAGIDQELAATIRRRFLDGEPSAQLVSDAMIRALTVAGTLEDAAARMLAYRDAGLASLVVIDDGGTDPEHLVDGVMAAARLAGLR
ncbi:LLM class flavin-dependent oxidoreductase [Pseudactinotalea suaedae]|uniref:LLM class flavin-dependent oxidoreductase n=1 Tax=Pseudactinotalea suaedae TaxID=1524924 RepID=UPI0012E163DE|nr:LLM class flavin-dependent oxidoreductase [Pseudactinotalea suaedae]